VSSEDLRERYEREGSSVERYANSSLWDRRYHERRMAFIKRTVGDLLGRDGSFLDVGCGTGEYLAWAASATNGEVHGCDLAEEYCRRARSVAPQATVRQSSAEALPYADQSIDVVMCSEVIEHIPYAEQGAVVAELMRVARRHVVVTTPNRESAVRRIGEIVSREGVQRLDEEVGHIALLNVNELRDLLSGTGFVVEPVRTQHTVPPVIGERLCLPKILETPVSVLEKGLDRVLSGRANQLVVVASRVPCA
jgi:2-polyprenyl-3-methyl-5-hydroxy-6-metoxy-1,4-benzoquinol methylase